MKKVMSSIMILILLLVLSIPAFADEMDMKTIESVLQEIQTAQNVQDVKQIDPDKVTPDLLDQLGDVVMGKLIGDNERHEWMDKMLGGDGSETLKSFHMDLGYRYLKGEPLTMQSMMMGNQSIRKDGDFGRSGGYGMMNNLGFGRGFGMMNGTGGMIMGLLILVLVGGGIYLLARKSGNQAPGGSNAPIEILKQRYAKGEITQEEFERMKANLDK